MKTLGGSVLLLLCLTAAIPQALATGPACAGGYCPSGFLCLDRFGEGEACWQICRENMPQLCDAGCCREITHPFQTWVCVAESECEGADGDAESDESFLDCSEDEDVCTSLQACIKLEDERKLCAPFCSVSDDCASGCCADISTGQKACMPSDIECPQSQDDDSSKDSGCQDKNGPFCDAGALKGSSGLSVLLALAGLAFARRLVRRRAR